MEEIKKSISAILYERTTSPLFGTLIFSWLLWNWEIPYLSFFVSENKLKINKIEYIMANHNEIHHLITYPVISTFILLTIIPFISNGAFWLSLRFNKWKIDQKNIVDKKQLLSIEQSIELREEISKQEERFAKLVEDKNIEIKQLNLELQDYREKVTSQVTIENILNNSGHTNADDDLLSLVNRLKDNPKEHKEYEKIIDYIQRGYTPVDRTDVTNKFVALLESYNIINRLPNGNYSQTEIGKKFFRLLNQ